MFQPRLLKHKQTSQQILMKWVHLQLMLQEVVVSTDSFKHIHYKKI